MNISSVHSVFIDRGSVSAASSSIAAIASPELIPGSRLPVIGAAVARL